MLLVYAVVTRGDGGDETKEAPAPPSAGPIATAVKTAETVPEQLEAPPFEPEVTAEPVASASGKGSDTVVPKKAQPRGATTGAAAPAASHPVASSPPPAGPAPLTGKPIY